MIRLRGVDKIHHEGRPDAFQALYDVTLDVAAGEVVVVDGVSGSGKTTLLGIIGALMRPTRGEVTVVGRAVAKLPDRHASDFRAGVVGFVFQEFNLFDGLSVRDNVALPLVPRGGGARVVDERVAVALELANIRHKAHQKARDLSGGEKQRCAIARALVGDPKVILCDEPTASLDRENTRKFLEIVAALKNLGKTILIATHDPQLTEPACVDRVVRLHDGRIETP